MTKRQTLSFTALAMIAFAANSLLCRLALIHTAIDPASFTAVRVMAGAITLALIIMSRGGRVSETGSWASGLALFVYAAAFSFAYVSLSAATGALLLFGSVQVSMITVGLWRGERLSLRKLTGLGLAFGGLVTLLLPGLSAPPLASAVLMLAAGLAWGIYSLRAKGATDPIAVTAGNFLRAIPFAAALTLIMWPSLKADHAGILLAIASGALASGLGYAIWYAALRGLRATSAATVQLSVPVITALGGIVLLGEPLGLRVMMTSIAILGGIALVVAK